MAGCVALDGNLIFRIMISNVSTVRPGCWHVTKYITWKMQTSSLYQRRPKLTRFCFCCFWLMAFILSSTSGSITCYIKYILKTHHQEPVTDRFVDSRIQRNKITVRYRYILPVSGLCFYCLSSHHQLFSSSSPNRITCQHWMYPEAAILE